MVFRKVVGYRGLDGEKRSRDDRTAPLRTLPIGQDEGSNLVRNPNR